MRYPLDHGELILGRDAGARIVDDQVSRRHVRVALAGSEWSIDDLGSRNGTWLDGNRIEHARSRAPRVIRIGGALLVASHDVFTHEVERVCHADRPVVGAALLRAFDRISLIAAGSSTMLISGESGSGKELAARLFHDGGPRASGPFVAVNCATIPAHLAERLLFGARRGVYTGASANADGLVQAAAHGTLFLDEIAELDLAAQAKLLRVVDSREVLPLGATSPQRVELGLCFATHVNLSKAVERGRFRSDLRYRISDPGVGLPPLRTRGDEIAWHVQHVLDALGLSSHAALVEACLLRPWPGNVRELRAAIQAAAISAKLRGADGVRAADLPPECDAVRVSAPAGASRPPDDRIHEILHAHQGNVTRAARALGIHRNQLRRWIAKRESGADSD
jgi:transcriptional regulator with PAS, ATPase and Fis domain